MNSLRQLLAGNLLAVPVIALSLSSAPAQEASTARANARPSIPLCRERVPQALEYPDRMVQPKYPEAALKTGMEGAVDLRAVISSDGKTRELTLVKGDPVFATPTVQAVRKWRFHAVLVEGKRVQTTYAIHVRFVPILQEAVTDLEIESPPEDAPAAGEDAPAAREATTDLKFDTPEGPVYRVSKEGGVTSPKILYQRNPELSEKARELKEQGTVTISVIIGTDGKPRNFEVTCSSARDLSEKAIEAAKDWRFEPATKDGKTVMVQVSLDFTFRQY